MLNLCLAEHLWYYRNPEKAKILYVGKKQQEEMELSSQSVQWLATDGNRMGFKKPREKITRYSGYKVVYVDEEDYLKLGN